MEGYKFSLDLAVDKQLTETQKNQLMVQLGAVVQQVLGKEKSGVILIHTPRCEQNSQG